MKTTILSVAYPFAPVGPDAVGGAEQVLARLDAALITMGWRSVVIACDGSQARGILHPVGPVPSTVDEGRRQLVWQRCRAAVDQIVRTGTVDLVHMHGLDFAGYLPPLGVTTLVTIHLPLNHYPPDVLDLRRRNVHFNCVSYAQRASGGQAWQDVPVVENGVLEEEVPATRKRHFVLALGRICPEKGFHDAVAAARLADTPLLLAGQVFPYPEHQAYFRDQLVPLLDDRRRFVGPVGGARKWRLLSSAGCLVVPSLVEESSSLVAMEALTAGTPVVARPVGALVDIIEHGKTGFLVEDANQMACAMRLCATLDPEDCRSAARRRFGAFRMVGDYLSLYGALLAGQGEVCSTESTWHPNLTQGP